MLNPQIFLERKLSFLPCFWYISPDETAFVRWRLARRLAASRFTDISITPFDWLHPKTPARFAPTVENLSLMLESAPLVREFSGSLLIRAQRP